MVEGGRFASQYQVDYLPAATTGKYFTDMLTFMNIHGIVSRIYAVGILNLGKWKRRKWK